MSNLKQNGRLRWSPSYLRRRGQMTPAQKKAMRDHWHRFGIEYQHGQTLGLADIFDPDKPDLKVHLEIGFGMGENLIHQTVNNPGVGILGIEVHKPGIGAAIKKIVDSGSENVRVMRGDARLVLSDFLAPTVRFNRVSVLFPDPWPDMENAHRRIVQPDLIALLEPRMAPQGELHLATDVDIYALHCREVMAKQERWIAHPMGDLTNYRCATQYEQKGIEKGHSISDQLYRFS